MLRPFDKSYYQRIYEAAAELNLLLLLSTNLWSGGGIEFVDSKSSYRIIAKTSSKSDSDPDRVLTLNELWPLSNSDPD